VAVWGARGTRAAVIFDLDGDGDLDIVTNEFNAAPMVLVSNLSEKMRLRASRSSSPGPRRIARARRDRQGDRGRATFTSLRR
jgi:hypothetical protein